MTTEANTVVECKTNYVYLEMVLNKDNKYDVIAGLFKGIVEKEGQTFILLQGLKNATNVLSTKFYNIMMIEEREGDHKNLTYLTQDKIDQETGWEMVEELYKKLVDAGVTITNDAKIIDVDKYTEVPDDYKDGKPVSKGTATSGTASGVGNFRSPHTRYNQGNTYTKQTTVKPDPTPGLIARTKTKKPAKSALQVMFEKVQEITAGTYEGEIPEILGEDDAGVQEAEEDTYNYGYGSYCC